MSHSKHYLWDSHLTEPNLVRCYIVDLQMFEAGPEGQVVLNVLAPHLVEKDRTHLLYFSFKRKVADYKRKDVELNLAEGQNVVDDVALGQTTKFD